MAKTNNKPKPKNSIVTTINSPWLQAISNSKTALEKEKLKHKLELEKEKYRQGVSKIKRKGGSTKSKK